MKRCQTCESENLDSSQYCEECGSRFAFQPNPGISPLPPVNSSGIRIGSVTSVGVPPLIQQNGDKHVSEENAFEKAVTGIHAFVVIERGESANTEFPMSGGESNIGRWDADNGIFPDIDLDTHDPDAKVSRRHARIILKDGVYMVEDLGSTNGTFVNRGRRLLPGSPQVLKDGDEIIVGKTFLRFHIGSGSKLQL